MKVILPHKFEPREYQRDFFWCLENGFKRAIAVWHRRAGKDKTFLNMLLLRMSQVVGTYYYIFPTYKQGKKAIWQNKDKDGMPFLAHIPRELIKKKHDTDMRIELVNDSAFQIIGSDNFDNLMGPNPVGCIFSEFALQNPAAWDYFQPILMENDGWAIFNSTPRGHNHLYDLYMKNKDNPTWYTSLLTVEDTGVVSQGQIDQAIADGMAPETARQEFYCDFDSAIRGAYFAKYVREIREKGQICKVPIERGVPVHTWWDLGMNDRTAIILQQDVGREVHIIGYIEDANLGLPEYVGMLDEFHRKHNVRWGTDHLPHDGNVRDLGTGKSRKQQLHDLGRKSIKTYKRRKNQNVWIEPGRRFFARCWFSTEDNVDHLIHALVNYSSVYDEEYRVERNRPNHDWASHGADAYQVMAANHQFGNDRGSGYDEYENRREAPSALGWA